MIYYKTMPIFVLKPLHVSEIAIRNSRTKKIEVNSMSFKSKKIFFLHLIVVPLKWYRTYII